MCYAAQKRKLNERGKNVITMHISCRVEELFEVIYPSLAESIFGHFLEGIFSSGFALNEGGVIDVIDKPRLARVFSQ